MVLRMEIDKRNKTDEMDKIERVQGALIQHGHFNNRIYLMDLGDGQPEAVIPALDQLALANKYRKIFAKIPKSLGQDFLDAGYNIEASIPMFYGDDEAVFLGKYFTKAGPKLKRRKQVMEVLETALSRAGEYPCRKPRLEGITFRRCRPDDAVDMSRLYSLVFASYPFPIFDPAYIVETMGDNVNYFCAEYEGRLIALSSADICHYSKTAEMTDFASHPKWRGHSLSLHLLLEMEREMEKLNIKTVYTIARALSPAMNISFSRMDYNYGGTLVNNTNIGGQIESMNVWYKYKG